MAIGYHIGRLKFIEHIQHHKVPWEQCCLRISFYTPFLAIWVWETCQVEYPGVVERMKSSGLLLVGCVKIESKKVLKEF